MYGTALAAFEEPLDMMQACHRRIEASLCALEKVPAHISAQGVDAIAREAARFALRYFDGAALEHHRDEEEDLFPLLRRRAGELHRAEISAIVNALQADHATMDLQWSRLREQLNALAQGRPVALAAADIAGFAWLYRRHMEKESAIVLPFAREALTSRERAKLGERMAARRLARV